MARNNNLAHLEPIVNPCAFSFLSPSKKQVGAVSTFKTFDYDDSQDVKTPQNVTQKQQAQLAFAAVASRNNRLKDLQIINEDESKKLNVENENTTRLKENQYWV